MQNIRKAIYLFSVAMMATVAVRGQMVPLVGNNLYFNADRVWSYNLYEQSRWGLGLRWTATPSWLGGNRLTADAYIGLGYLDQQWKWGVSLASAFAKSRHSAGVHASVLHDMLPAGSRALGSTTLADISSLSSFMNRRMAIATQLTAGASWRWKMMRHLTEAHAHNGIILFDNAGLLYPNDGDPCPAYRDYGLRWVGRHDAGLSAEVKAGFNAAPADRPYLRLLVQFARSYPIGPLSINLFGQGGILPSGAKGGYMQAFDLGGTSGAPIFFERSLLTATPNEFTVDRYIYITGTLRFKKPLFEWVSKVLVVGTAPRPFVRLGAAIGGIDEEYYIVTDGLYGLQAPTQGIAEGAAGIEGLVRWGVTDWGVAIAYRLTPASAPYHRDNPLDNMRLLLTANLNI